MPMSKKDMEKRWKVKRDELIELEEKCKGGSGSKKDYENLAKLRKKVKG